MSAPPPMPPPEHRGGALFSMRDMTALFISTMMDSKGDAYITQKCIVSCTKSSWTLIAPEKKTKWPRAHYTLGDRAISRTQNRCVLLNAQGGLTFYRLLNIEQKIFPRKGLTPVINLQVPFCSGYREQLRNDN